MPSGAASWPKSRPCSRWLAAGQALTALQEHEARFARALLSEEREISGDDDLLERRLDDLSGDERRFLDTVAVARSDQGAARSPGRADHQLHLLQAVLGVALTQRLFRIGFLDPLVDSPVSVAVLKDELSHLPRAP